MSLEELERYRDRLREMLRRSEASIVRAKELAEKVEGREPEPPLELPHS
jgi:hypothetical protein